MTSYLCFSWFKMAVPRTQFPLHWWPVIWMVVAMLLVIWDSAFVLLRPRTLPGNDLHWFFQPYELYIRIDEAYGNMDNAFTKAQSWLNIAEILLTLPTLALLVMKRNTGLLLGLTVNLLTLWKTVLYMTQYTPLCKSSSVNLDHLTWNEAILWFIIPNGMWILMPLACAVHYFLVLQSMLHRAGDKKSK